MTPEISVVMANYNGARYLAAALHSLKSQTFREWELIFVDDGSRDYSIATVSRFAAEDSRIHVVMAGQNRGPGAARNKAIDLAKGRWIAVFDSDDIMLPTRLEVLRQRAISDNAPIVVDDLLVFSDEHANSRRFLPHKLTQEPRWIALAEFIDSGRFCSRKADMGYLKPFISLEFLHHSGVRYNEKLRIGEDSDLIVRLLAPGFKLRLEPAAYYMYRKHPNSISHRIQRDSILDLVAANGGLIETMPHHQTDAVAALTRRQASLLSMLLYDETIRMLKAGDYGRAAAMSLATPRIWPLLTRPPRARLARLMNRNKRPTLIAAMPSLLAERPGAIIAQSAPSTGSPAAIHSLIGWNGPRSMTQTDIGRQRITVRLPTAARDAFELTQSAMRKRSQIVWGEHCTECAFPSCYSTCSYYSPRHDLHCRRFEHGIEHVDGANLTRIKFRRWGKLEGEGRVRLRSVGAAAISGAFDRTYERLSQFRPLGRRLNWRWNEAKRLLGGRGGLIAEGDVFVLEAWHEDTAAWPFTLSIMPKRKEKPGLFQFRIDLAPGYNRVVIPVSDIMPKVALDQTLIFQIEPLKEKSPTIIFGVTDFARLSRPLENVGGQLFPPQLLPSRPVAAGGRPKFKCVVWDLDNTLWQGVLAEDGVEGVRLSPVAARLVRELDRRGIINSIASKNDPELAMAALEKFGMSEYFVFPKIGWGPKSEGIKAIIADMDVGADTFAFIDDQAFERGEVSELLPDVAVFADTALGELLENPRFDVPITAESGKRREMYRTEERRNAARVNSAMNYTDFLRSCRIRLDIQQLSAVSLERVYELSQRTNQLNFSGLRYTRTELEQLMARRAKDTFVLASNDKFGDYGIIGFAVVNRDEALIESFFMSCRVQRKRVENAFFQFLAEELGANGAAKLAVRYRKTAKNHASVQMLKELGFDYLPAGEEDGIFSIGLPWKFSEHDVVEVVLIGEAAPAEAVA